MTDVNVQQMAEVAESGDLLKQQLVMLVVGYTSSSS